MDGLFHGKPYVQMDDLEVPLFLETSMYCRHIYIYIYYTPENEHEHQNSP